MISSITNTLTNIVSNANLANMAQNTTAAVFTETTLKAIGRPGFILIDQNIDPDTKKYAATKEFLYQATCLFVYFAAVVPLFKKGSFKLAKATIYKNDAVFQKFNSAKQYLEYHKLVKMESKDRAAAFKDKYHEDKFIPKLHADIQAELKKSKPEIYKQIKGAIEFGNMIGSVLGLAVLAPQVSHAFIHPALRLIGMEEKKSKNAQTSNEVPQFQARKIDRHG